MKKGTLVVVGFGVDSISQMTTETLKWIKEADDVFASPSDPLTKSWLMKTRPDAVNLNKFYGADKPRKQTYAEQREIILASLRRGRSVCLVHYGHPGVLVEVTHAAVRAAREEGYSARMLPGISSADCLFADLGVDPGDGCQMFEATLMMLRRQRPSKDCHVIVWQIGFVGERGWDPSGRFENRRVGVFADYLETVYEPTQPCLIYQAAWLPHLKPEIKNIKLADIRTSEFPLMATLYIPPVEIFRDVEMEKKLGWDEPLEPYNVV